MNKGLSFGDSFIDSFGNWCGFSFMADFYWCSCLFECWETFFVSGMDFD